jgi:hypothetical protein
MSLTIRNNDQAFVPGSTLVLLNEVLQQSLLKCDAANPKLNAIVRCESLPQIPGSPAPWAALFDFLLATITDGDPIGSRLFLYIDCKEGVTESGNAAEGIRWYQVSFHTNITADEAWCLRNKEKIEQSHLRAATCGGSLSVQNLAQTGCLYLITISGKI